MQRITIVGAGKLTRCFVLGLLKKGYNPECITVVYRSNYDNVKDINVSFTQIVPENTDVCIHMVRPQDVGELSVMINSRIDFFNSIPNIFIVSGMKSSMFMKHIKLKKNSYVIGTMNTNIKNNAGLIYLGTRKLNALKYFKIFEMLGSVFYTETKNILNYVTIVGSGNALDILFIKQLLVEKFPLSNFNFKLKEIKKCLESPEKKLGSCCEIVDEYINNKIISIRQIFNWSKKEAEDISYKTLLSTINFFSHESLLTALSLDHHLRTVVTSKGCTEEGLKEVKKIRDFSDIDKIKNFYSKVSERANKFEKDILDSIAESQKNNK